MTDEMHSELLAVIAMAQETNSLANSLQVPVDDCFEADR
jgi:alkylhydroperoxidase family enzyme